MTRVLIWDLPIRWFHWLLAATVLPILAIAHGTDDESALFPVHMLLGLVAGVMVLLRIVWGVTGSKYARFSSFFHGPRALLEYLKGIIDGTKARWLGHNPASSFAVSAILALVCVLCASGLVVASGGPRAAKELHEGAASGLLIVSVLHVMGVILHVVRHRDNLVLSMVDGKKEGAPAEAIASSHGLVAAGFLAVVVAAAATVFTGYDSRTRTLSVPGLGTRLVLGEREEQGVKLGGERYERELPRRHQESEREHHGSEHHDDRD